MLKTWCKIGMNLYMLDTNIDNFFIRVIFSIRGSRHIYIFSILNKKFSMTINPDDDLPTIFLTSLRAATQKSAFSYLKWSDMRRASQTYKLTNKLVRFEKNNLLQLSHWTGQAWYFKIIFAKLIEPKTRVQISSFCLPDDPRQHELEQLVPRVTSSSSKS